MKPPGIVAAPIPTGRRLALLAAGIAGALGFGLSHHAGAGPWSLWLCIACGLVAVLASPLDPQRAPDREPR